MMSVNPARPTPLEDKFILTSEEAAEWPLRSGDEFPCHDDIWADSAAPLGSLACQIHGSQRSTEGGPQTFTTKAEAGRWLSRTESEMERGQFVDPKVGKELLSGLRYPYAGCSELKSFLSHEWGTGVRIEE
jgi:hypothetical protein